MSKRAFWPGFRWRILAHEKGTASGRGHYTGPQKQIYAGWEPSPVIASDVERLHSAWEFDELVIDHWLHLEQMDTRDWWIGIGNPDHGDYWHVNVHINADRRVEVHTEKLS